MLRGAFVDASETRPVTVATWRDNVKLMFVIACPAVTSIAVPVVGLQFEQVTSR